MATGVFFARRRRAEVQGAGKLIGLHADHADQPGSGPRDRFADFFRPDALVGLVIDEDFDSHVGAERLAMRAIGGDARAGRPDYWREWPSAAIE